MASFSIYRCVFLVFLIIVSFLQVSMGGKYSCKPEECPSRCAYRCSAASAKERCLDTCNDCCLKCLEVPPGTWGHKDLTPCYNSLKTKKGQPKCP
ncbi:hypothetical protein DCAR_0101512 [Daucus carota subsp. sativus]|uniref:Gibberellin regulated protein n=1 Tax=Daucus carota subsp. sativus TaxID=79200 RepID=A0AAF1AGW2_DAUCS|nr:hypothetical protein DCAR_0101512 [Daucus carota subsp. sativus]